MDSGLSSRIDLVILDGPTTSGLPSTPDLTKFASKSVWCQQRTHASAGNSKSPPGCSRAGHRIWPAGRYHRLDHGQSPAADSRAGSWPTDFYGSQLLIHKLPTTIT